MVYTPRFNTINSRVIVDNLLTYWLANQADAFTWAGDSSLKTLKKFEASVTDRSVPVFPAVTFADDSEAIDYAGDTVIALYQPAFNVMITNADPDEAVRQAWLYSKALTSLLINCPKSTLAANTGAAASATIIEDMATAFDPIRADEEQIDFMQLFQIRPTIRLEGSAFV
jgi:hypothetical protein